MFVHLQTLSYLVAFLITLSPLGDSKLCELIRPALYQHLQEQGNLIFSCCDKHQVIITLGEQTYPCEIFSKLTISLKFRAIYCLVNIATLN